MGKRVIAQHCAMPGKVGGPAAGLRLLRGHPFMQERYDLPLISQDEPAGGINLRLIFHMARSIRACHPDLLHVRGLQNEGFHGVVAGRLAGCPRIIVSIHGSVSESRSTGRLRCFIFSRIIEPLTLWLADGFYCVCHSQAERLRLSGKRKFLGIIHNAAPHFRSLDDDDKLLLRKRLNLAQDDMDGIYVGRLTMEKGLEFLVQALKAVWQKTKKPAVKFLLAGDGPAMVELQRQFQSEIAAGKLLFLGDRSDIQELLQIADFFVFPTLHENLSNALLEACCAGIAVIATDVGGNPEVIEDGREGILVPPADSEALAEAMILLAGNPDLRQRLGENARARIRQDFDAEVIMRRISTLYEKLLAPSRNSGGTGFIGGRQAEKKETLWQK